MQHTARTAPDTIARPPAVAVLAAVVLALLAALTVAGPPPGTPGGPMAGMPGAGPVAGVTGGPVAGAAYHHTFGPRAGDGCDTACAVRAATRLEAQSEHPAPRAHLAVCGQGTALSPPGPARLSAPTGSIPASEPHAPHVRGRAPPASSGT
ncbi:hypothetical protein [Streptomyces sp. SP18CS02]|uniref:hypothetical protein n=1 Tax=Streptomyces sp. SP18CS02 TaxID=3002531 RepID=UPI002E769BFF|nr:hypothetical protein [Streptomyces sp. SP18CS02]MEE1752810.1 hypothetical protein [Streptomyces sp. SP18CS02]